MKWKADIGVETQKKCFGSLSGKAGSECTLCLTDWGTNEIAITGVKGKQYGPWIYSLANIILKYFI